MCGGGDPAPVEPAAQVPPANAALGPLQAEDPLGPTEEKRVLPCPPLAGADQVGRSRGLIQTRRLTCEVVSLDRAGGSAAPYLSLGSAAEALPGPLLWARLGGSQLRAQTAQQTLHLQLYSSLYGLTRNAATRSFVSSS